MTSLAMGIDAAVDVGCSASDVGRWGTMRLAIRAWDRAGHQGYARSRSIQTATCLVGDGSHVMPRQQL